MAQPHRALVQQAQGRVFPTPGVVSGAELELRGYIGTVLGEPPWYRRVNKNQAISAQPSERAREGARRALHFPKMKRHRWSKAQYQFDRRLRLAAKHALQEKKLHAAPSASHALNVRGFPAGAGMTHPYLTLKVWRGQGPWYGRPCCVKRKNLR
jgi:hypothetical protein